jgi:hypothetical protein
MEQNSNSITDLDLQYNPIENEGASLLAAALENKQRVAKPRKPLSF